MKLRSCLLSVVTLAALFAACPASAHFLWVETVTEGDHPHVNVYFGESALPDDPELLTNVTGAKIWVMGNGGRHSEPQPLEPKLQDDELTAPLPEDYSGGPVVLRHTYGVLTRGEQPFLLNYYAKTYSSPLPGQWDAIEDDERLPLEIVPEWTGSEIKLTVLYEGEAVTGSQVVVDGPGLSESVEGETDESGHFTCQLPKSGVFSIRARMIEESGGEYEGQAYEAVRHYSTLTLKFESPDVKTVAQNWPPLAKGTTSFGGAIIGDDLYVYGGHYGRAHHYSVEGQSGDFQRLNLADSNAWEALPGGPKLTGLAMVAADGKLYRVGGFTAKNTDDEDESLWSNPDFARFDPSQGSWDELPPLPEGRSSHDAAMVGDVLYVAGGWLMQAGEETKWHTTAWSIDLSADQLEWKQIADPPFLRRAVALAEWQGKLYVIGGMEKESGPTTATSVYDPQSNAWSEGPDLLGTGMEGFGSSAFAADGSLYTTTMSGAIQRLSQDGSHWEFVGQLDQPRFFHRMLPWHQDQLVVVGGASMDVGKLESLELISVKPESQSEIQTTGLNE